jgi:hypothetical protein
VDAAAYEGGMIGVILIAVLNVAMFSWFFYLAAKDPSNVFKRRRPADHQPAGDDQPPQG